ncbi:BlaI/MecI/CopY family transcriptional regulator [Dyadobacter fermentans]|uniref:Transcriptional repressor, CopY family n=1 Tax=Dyadobacter fermentans (strain ATCC 700827 / DSM 18053 / CIP 107007 / KCTC 52180 / NS114) TaxID=471854 RepID=C6W269_DYAFD|nr:BlaI/MecI/CopY family transcriptional regulator [Dyadobacter fermentans]ACT92042.1 transcriptional repressor, CopY family [Dyadobacter fermentans DSM 18053]
MEPRSLTRAEAEIMKILWQLGKAFIKDILAQMDDPKPAYTTVATFVRILEKKGIVAHNTYGNTHEFYPLISEQEYRKYEVQQLVENYFDNSVSNLVSFFMKDDNLKKSDLDDLAAFIEKNRSKS